MHFKRDWSWLVVVFLLFFATPPPADAVIEDVLDIIHVVKEVTVGILKAWDIVQQSQFAQNIEFPLMREKQRKVLQRLKELGRQIDQTEQKYAQNVAVAVESVTEFMNQNVPLMTKMNDIHDTMNRISSRFQQMQKYEAHQHKLEESTLITFAEWTVSPNAYSVHHLMERLHLILLGPEEKENTTTNMLSLLAQTYEVKNVHMYNATATHSCSILCCISYVISRLRFLSKTTPHSFFKFFKEFELIFRFNPLLTMEIFIIFSEYHDT